MQISATELKQKTHLLNRIEEEDIIVTKHSKPFAVIIEYEKYRKLQEELGEKENRRKIEALESLGAYRLGGKDFAQIKSEMEI